MFRTVIQRVKRIKLGLIVFIFLQFRAFGYSMDELIKLDNLPDKTHQLLAKYPSMGMGIAGINDLRIKYLAQLEKDSFKIEINYASKLQNIILVNAKKWKGWLWWRNPKKIQISISKLNQIRQGKTFFTAKEKKFIQEL